MHGAQQVKQLEDQKIEQQQEEEARVAAKVDGTNLTKNQVWNAACIEGPSVASPDKRSLKLQQVRERLTPGSVLGQGPGSLMDGSASQGQGATHAEHPDQVDDLHPAIEQADHILGGQMELQLPPSEWEAKQAEFWVALAADLKVVPEAVRMHRPNADGDKLVIDVEVFTQSGQLDGATEAVDGVAAMAGTGKLTLAGIVVPAFTVQPKRPAPPRVIGRVLAALAREGYAVAAQHGTRESGIEPSADTIRMGLALAPFPQTAVPPEPGASGPGGILSLPAPPPPFYIPKPAPPPKPEPKLTAVATTPSSQPKPLPPLPGTPPSINRKQKLLDLPPLPAPAP